MKRLTFCLKILSLVIVINACKSTQSAAPTTTNQEEAIEPLKLSGGSSGMVQIDDQSYLVVYDLKNFKDGVRVGLIKISDEAIKVTPITINSWDEEGQSSDLESICDIPGRAGEYLIAESGNWQGKLGRLFHIQLNAPNSTATVLGSVKLPMLHKNDIGLTGDQYEAILCLPYSDKERLVLLGERGGSAVNPTGLIRWGILDLEKHEFRMTDSGQKGIPVTAPGTWVDAKSKRDITDFHVDAAGDIWTAACEDQGDAGPFYSVIYKVGKLDPSNKEQPFQVFNTIDIWKEITGFKIEALSGPVKNIDCTHSFGTEDEMYGGVWRAIKM